MNPFRKLISDTFRAAKSAVGLIVLVATVAVLSLIYFIRGK